MNTQTKIWTGIGIAAFLIVVLAIGGWFFNPAFAHGPWQGGFMRMGHTNQAVLDLLKTNETDLLQQRQGGASWLDIATASDVREQALTDALLQQVTQMHAWMGQNYPQADLTSMTESMRTEFSKDMRVAQYGTMTDMHVFGGGMMSSGLMNGGMMNGGMMGGGMMNGGMMNGGMMNSMMGGMMGGSFTAPTVNATPVPSTQSVDREIKITTQNFKFDPSQVQVRKGETVKFTITNQDNFAHNVVSQDGKLAFTLLPANQTTSIVWVAPNQAGIYSGSCTFHPGMRFQIAVE